MPNQGHKFCKNYTYEGFVNKRNNKVVLKREQIKERKNKQEITHQHQACLPL
jgi:hypothetical protein